MSSELARGNRRSTRRVNRLRKVAGLALAVMIASGAATLAQKNPYRNYTEQKFVENMQTAGRNYAAVKDFVAKKDYESAKAQLTRAREQLAITITFWRESKREDAVAMLRKSLNAMDELDVALGAEKADSSAVATASQRLDASCEACHAVYREQDPATKAYRIKPGSVR
jgi:cytochrome c556